MDFRFRGNDGQGERPSDVIPAEAGIHSPTFKQWISDSAGMTMERSSMSFLRKQESTLHSKMVSRFRGKWPAEAGIHSPTFKQWIPASAGMTGMGMSLRCQALAVIPAEAGIHSPTFKQWIPASAGMTGPFDVIPAEAGIHSPPFKQWIPAFAGMTARGQMDSRVRGNDSKGQMDSRFRGNDRHRTPRCHSCGSRNPLSDFQQWIPAFAGMTARGKWIPASAGMTAIEHPRCHSCGSRNPLSDSKGRPRRPAVSGQMDSRVRGNDSKGQMDSRFRGNDSK
ncbi:hypothetical protein QUF72_04320 [Desulfobacterales bacterium HSG2]|nr:hypothetical protein [Desulfobacterales bacterium HSG2]